MRPDESPFSSPHSARMYCGKLLVCAHANNDHERAISPTRWIWLPTHNLLRVKLKAFHHHFGVVCWRRRRIAVVAKIDIDMSIVRNWHPCLERPYDWLSHGHFVSRDHKFTLIWVPVHLELERSRRHIEMIEICGNK